MQLRYFLLQFFPDMAGLQPPVLQKVFAFQVHSGEFVQIIHVRNNHWCVVAYQIGAISVRGGGGGGRRGANDIFHLLTQCIDSVDNQGG